MYFWCRSYFPFAIISLSLFRVYYSYFSPNLETNPTASLTLACTLSLTTCLYLWNSLIINFLSLFFRWFNLASKPASVDLAPCISASKVLLIISVCLLSELCSLSLLVLACSDSSCTFSAKLANFCQFMADPSDISLKRSRWVWWLSSSWSRLFWEVILLMLDAMMDSFWVKGSISGWVANLDIAVLL